MKRPNFFYHLHPPKIPSDQARFVYTLGLGGLGVFFFSVASVTGALLLFYYVPSAEHANDSIQILSYHVPMGWMVRNLHYWASQALVLIAGLHLLRVALTGAFRSPRRFNWLLGMGLFLAILGLDFSGYVLRWDEGVGWALLVGTNLLREIPIIGGELYQLAVGASSIGDGTVLRFYGWHVFGLMLPAALLVGWHIFRVRRDGGISSPAPVPGTRKKNIPRAKLVQIELLAALLAATVLLLLATLFDAPIGPAFDPDKLAAEPRAPWFFLWVQEFLRWGDAFWMGVILPVAILLLLAIMPYRLDRGRVLGQWFPEDGRVAQALTLGLTIAIVVLTIVGLLR